MNSSYLIQTITHNSISLITGFLSIYTVAILLLYGYLAITLPHYYPSFAGEVKTHDKSLCTQLTCKEIPTPLNYYIVETGDSIAKIGKKLCNNNRAWLSIVQENAITFPYRLHAGQQLRVSCN